VKRYHVELRRVYQMISEDLNTESTINKEIVLQMIVKAINDTVDSDKLILILLIFEAYFRMHVINSSTPSITQRAMIIEKVMTEIRKYRVERQIVDVSNTRNDSIITSIHDLFLNLDVLIWRENKKWTELFKLLDIEDETCKIVLSSESTDFRSTVIKLFLIESIIESINDAKSINENVQSIFEDVQSSDHQNNLFDELLEIIKSLAVTKSFAITRFTRARRLSLRYQNVVNIIVFLQDEDSHSNQFEDAFISTLTLIFMKSRRKEINNLLKRRVFELIIIENVSLDVRIFNFRFVDEIKHSSTSDAYEKFRLMIQTYNDQDKTLILTQLFIIQRMSQRIILVLAAIIKHNLYLRDKMQTYVQLKISLNREFFIRSFFELDLSERSILKVIKSLYDVLETRTYWFNTYQKHHKKKLLMIESIFDFCLLHII
jgi:hypothetical protein